TVIVRDANGNVIPSASVTVGATGTANTFGATFPITANGSGVATVTLASTRAESKTVSATANGTARDDQQTVTVTRGTACPTTGRTTTATIGGGTGRSPLPTITVTPGSASLSASTVTTSSSTVVSGATATLTLQARDGAGNNLTAGGLTVVFTQSGGTSTGTKGGRAACRERAYTATGHRGTGGRGNTECGATAGMR